MAGDEVVRDLRSNMHLGRLLAVVLAIALPISNIRADAASSKCSRIGLQQKVGKAKYLCVKSGKKLIWHPEAKRHVCNYYHHHNHR